jgi:hypothetical protein
MSNDEVRRYTAGQRLMDGAQIMNRVQRNSETAIVRDLEQSVNGGPKGAYYDVYVEGKLVCAFSTEAEARDAVTRHQRDS